MRTAETIPPGCLFELSRGTNVEGVPKTGAEAGGVKRGVSRSEGDKNGCQYRRALKSESRHQRGS